MEGVSVEEQGKKMRGGCTGGRRSVMTFGSGKQGVGCHYLGIKGIGKLLVEIHAGRIVYTHLFDLNIY